MVVNDPATLAEVERAFLTYETALVGNDVQVLDELFWHDGRTIRFGAGENLFGFADIAAFRAGRSAQGLERELERTIITTFGTEYATASTLFRRGSTSGTIGRQMQTWVRFPEGWRIVAAHVSLIDEPR